MDPDVVRQIRFTLPKAVMPDHDPLTLANTTDSGSPLKKLKIVLDISMGRTILRVFSTSHPETRMFQCYKNTGAPDPCHVRASYETTDPLTKDFVVTIRAEGLDNSRCFAQRHRAYGRTTMHLTLIPEFDIPIMRSQEYILLLDRSGSMSGSRIETAKRTVTSLLHALPSEGTIFNIFSFGSSYESLYGTSVQYNQQSLDTVVSRSFENYSPSPY